MVHQLSGIRGEVLPVFSVADGAVLQPNFGGSAYAYSMPIGFQGIIKSMSSALSPSAKKGPRLASDAKRG